MVAFALTASSVRLTSGTTAPARTANVTAAEAIEPGDPVDSSGYIIDVTNAAKREIRGIAINYAGIGNVAVLAVGGELEFTETVTVGQYLYAETGGNWQYGSDLASGDGSVRIGVASGANKVTLDPVNTGVVVP